MSTKRIGILVSGGMDSVLLWFLRDKFAPEGSEFVPIRVDLGHGYTVKERAAIMSLDIPLFAEVKCDLSMLLKDLSEENVMIRNRNVLLVTIASVFNVNEVWLSPVKGEMHEGAHDKNFKFLEMASKLFSYTAQKWEPEGIVVRSPLENTSKVALVGMALANGVTKEQIVKTASCLSTKHSKCGRCIICVRRCGIFKQHGFSEKYTHDWWKEPLALSYLKKLQVAKDSSDFSHYDENRIAECDWMIEKVRDKLLQMEG